MLLFCGMFRERKECGLKRVKDRENVTCRIASFIPRPQNVFPQGRPSNSLLKRTGWLGLKRILRSSVAIICTC